MRYLFSVLITTLVFSAAHAGLSITVGPEGAGASVGAEYTASRGQTLWIGVYAQDMPDTGQFDAWLGMWDYTGVPSDGYFVGNSNLYIPPAIPSAVNTHYPYMSWVGEYWELINSDAGSSVSGNGLIADYEYYCDSEGDVVIDLGLSGGLEDTLTIHQLAPVDPIIEASPSVVTFNTTLAGGNPGPETLSIVNDGVGTLNWTVNESCSWLSASPASGSCTSETDVVTLSADKTGLSFGTHVYELTVSDPNAVNNPQTVTVYLNIGGITLSSGGTYATIQDAINAAVSGVDTVIVPDGTYKGIGNRDIDFLGKAITVRSENGSENCIIDCEWATPGFAFHNSETATSLLKGFTITHGFRPGTGDGGGIDCENSSPKITDCILTDNGSINSSWGGGIGCLNSNATIERCIIENNNAFRGGGVSSGNSSLTVRNCLIIDNTANITEYGGGLYSDGGYKTSRFINCTVVGNSAGRGGAIDIITSTAVITNCIFWNNLPSEITHTGTGTAIVSNSDIDGDFAGTDNIDVDPQFGGPGDYRLTFGSLCIDTGTNSPPTGLPATDLEGVTRPLDGDGNGSSIADMGAYEFYYDPGSPIVGISPLEFYFSCPVGGPDPDSKTMGIWNGAGGTLNWQITEDCDWLTVSPGSGSSSGEIDEVVLTANSAGLTADMYNCMFSVFNADDANDIRYVNVDFRVGPTLLVPSQYATIQAAINASFDGDEVIVADGVYTGNGNRDIDYNRKAITLRSASGDPNRCIIDCQGSSSNNHRGFYFHSGENADSILDGFTIINGYAPTVSSGGGIFCVSEDTEPTIRNCIIRDNKGSHGGGIGCIGSDPRIMNCVITNNIAISHVGGGFYLWDSSLPNMTGCTISDNSAIFGGGAIYSGYNSNPKIANSIIWNNSSSSGADEINGSAIVSYSDVKGGYSGIGNINKDPKFVDQPGGDYHLSVHSPCVDAGDPDYSPAPEEWDIDGEQRVMNERVDMGADEISDMITDFDDSGDIGVVDLVTLMVAWLSQPGDINWNPNYDANLDNVIDSGDFTLLSKYWLTEIDTESPSTPANVTATGVTNSTVSLVWDISTDNVRVAGYCVFRNGSYIGWSATAEYTDTDLDPSTPYVYTVLAYDLAYNLSPLSDLCQATTDG